MADEVLKFIITASPEQAVAGFKAIENAAKQTAKTASDSLGGMGGGLGKVKNPFEFVVSSLRATGADIQDARPLVRAVQQLGMPLYQCQPPTGYKDTADTWVNTGALVSRMNTALTLASGKLPGTRIGDVVDPLALLPGAVSDTTKATIARAQAAPQAVALTLGSPEFQRK